eukprot:scaffold246509_cov50-Cyclotella_meneghiniana.AAC.1
MPSSRSSDPSLAPLICPCLFRLSKRILPGAGFPGIGWVCLLDRFIVHTWFLSIITIEIGYACIGTDSTVLVKLKKPLSPRLLYDIKPSPGE